MTRVSQVVSRVRTRVAFPALAVAMGMSTLGAGLAESSFLGDKEPGATVSVTAEPASLDGVTRALRVATSGVTRVVDAPASVATAELASLDRGMQHPRIDEWVHRLTTSGKQDFERSLERMGKYDGMISAKLAERNMPRELIYLALIESNFNPTAKSRVSAVGMWQFMSGTARQFGLTVGRGRDERRDPAKATDAALTYLGTLHDRFGSWYLAAAAYNSGQGTVSKALRKVTGRTTGTDEDFFRILGALPKETQSYVPKLIASARVGSNPEQYGLD